MYTIGIDIGGTKIKFGMFDSQKRVVEIEEIKTPGRLVLEKITFMIESMINGKELRGIGIATAGIVDFEKGVITKAANVDSFVNIPLKTALEEVFHVPVVVDNDANSAALAEGVLGAAKLVNSYICVTIGTGIGGGIIFNDNLVHGMNGYGGEIGHMSIVPDGLLCGCGRRGCWEMYASGKALERMIKESSWLASSGYSPRELFKKYTENEHCKIAVDYFIGYLSIGIINLQYLFDPEMIVIGGGVTDSGDHWWETLQEKAANNSPIPLNLQRAELKNNAGMIGAGFLLPEK